jgi:hypothetical protein
MAVTKKTLFAENLDRYNTFVQDTNPNSRYFNITELPDTFTGGKNAFLIAGSNELVADTLIKIEIKDAAGEIIYHEPGEGYLLTNINGESFPVEYYEGVSKVVAVYIYPDTTAYGPCTITILGELSNYYDDNGLLSPIPLEWQGTYNVKWQKKVNVNPTLANTTKVRFYRRPAVSISEIVSPIYRIDSNSGLKVNTGINQSFADIKLSQMDTFAGDIKRIKVFRTSLGDISDYDMIQDILVESKEELTSYDLSGSVVGNAGLFTSEVLQKLWTTSPGMYATLDSTKVDNGVMLVATNDSAKFTYTSSLNLSQNSVYEFGIDAVYASAVTASNLNIFISGSNNGEVLIGSLEGIVPTKNLKDSVIQFSLSKSEPTASLYLMGSGSSDRTWHIGNLSLKLSQDTAFSPDSVSFITSMPTVVGDEDFNFKFEFYDINNNYVPVAVTASANFTGGSNTITKLLTFESDRTAFRFSSGSVGNPPTQFVRFKTQRTNFTGSITYSSASFDVNGNYILPASYAGEYPGALSNVSDAGALLSIAKFSGSVSSVVVGSIVYTASCEGVEEYETIYRFEDGENAPGVFVTSNTNQFIYKATDLSLNPSGQTITIEAKRKNLASATTPLTVNSGSGKPPLTFVSTNATNGVDTYTIAGTAYPYGTGETTYFISGSDQFGNEFSDAIKITPVKILDGLSATLTNDNASLPALSNGFVASGSFYFTSGSVNVKVGNETITFDDDNDSARANNTFAITNLSGTGCTPNGGNNSNPSENAYSITNLTADSGSLDITINYKDGAGDTTDIVKIVTYTKNKKAAPVLAISSTNKVQSVSAKSTGVQIDAFSNVTISVNETYNGATTSKSLSSLTATSSDISSIVTDYTTGVVTLNGRTLADGTNSTTITITAVVTDSEGVSRTVTDTLSLSKVKKAPPAITFAITPSSQTVAADSAGTLTGTIVDPVLTAFEGSSALTYNQSTLTTSQYKITNVTGVTVASTTPSTSTIDVTGISSTDNTGVVTISYIDSEGTSGTSTIKFVISKAIAGAQGNDGTDGTNGTDGNDGAPGADGPGVVFRGPWSSSTTYYDTGDFPTRRDAVLYNGTYYATKVNATTNLNKQPDTQTAFWESLGTDSFFVAAEIAIFRESYVKQTINVGTNTSGNANITIAGGTTSPYISIGQSTKGYNQTGIFLGTDSTAQKLSLKGSSGSLLWDGDTLTINGSGTFSGALSAATGTFNGSVSIGSGDSIFKADSNGIYLGNATFASAPFRVTPAGVLTATSGTIGGWTLGNTTLTGGAATLNSGGSISVGSGNNIFKADSNGIYVGNAAFDDAPFRVSQAGAVIATNLTLTGGSLSLGSGATYANINSSGKLTAANVDVAGRITATEGFIGDWVLTGPNLYAAVGTKKLQLAAGRPAMELYNGSAIVVDINTNTTLSDKSAGSVSPSPSSISSYNTPINYEFYDNKSGPVYSYTNNTDLLGPSTSTFTISSGNALIGSTCTISATVSGTGGTFAASGDDSHMNKNLIYMEWNFSYGFKLVTPSGTEYVVQPVSYDAFLNQVGTYTMTETYGTFTLSTSVVLEAGTYYITPVLNNVYAAATLQSSNLPGPAEFQLYMRTPLLGSISAAVPVSKTELSAGGFQVVYDTSKYLEVKRANETDFVKIGGGLTVTGDVTANTSSDIRLKDNLIRIENPLEKISLINGYTYDWKEGYEDIHTNKGNDIGVIAQEIEVVLPQLVTTRDNGFKAVRYDKIVALLIESIKELKEEIEELKTNK